MLEVVVASSVVGAADAAGGGAAGGPHHHTPDPPPNCIRVAAEPALHMHVSLETPSAHGAQLGVCGWGKFDYLWVPLEYLWVNIE